MPPDRAHREALSVDYIVVAFRSEPDLRACLDSIADDASPGAGIVVVDNASPDSSAAVARGHSSGPQVVSSEINLGFGGGCNLGAQVSKADVLFFVNPDARICRGATTTLLRALMDDARTAIVGPRIADAPAGSRVTQAGAEPSVRSALGHFLLLGRMPMLSRIFRPLCLADPMMPARPDWVSGAALMVRRRAFDEIRGFDERMFMYMEDVDLCRRARLAGWNVAYVPGAVVTHETGGSQGAEQPARWYRAFHQYVVVREGAGAARVVSFIAAGGLALRWVSYRRTRPLNAERVGRAAWQALRLALAPSRASAPEFRPRSPAKPEVHADAGE